MTNKKTDLYTNDKQRQTSTPMTTKKTDLYTNDYVASRNATVWHWGRLYDFRTISLFFQSAITTSIWLA